MTMILHFYQLMTRLVVIFHNFSIFHAWKSSRKICLSRIFFLIFLKYCQVATGRLFAKCADMTQQLLPISRINDPQIRFLSIFVIYLLAPSGALYLSQTRWHLFQFLLSSSKLLQQTSPLQLRTTHAMHKISSKNHRLTGLTLVPRRSLCFVFFPFSYF